MERTFDVVALGEALIDFTEYGTSPTGARLFEQNPGGAPANVLCAVAKLGGHAAFIGKVGSDMHGVFLRNVLSQAGVDVSGMRLDDGEFTTLAFVAVDANGERSFSFARKPGADTCLTSGEVPLTLLEQGRIFHVGSLSLTDEPVRSATLFAIEEATKRGAIISYDPNYRASLWRSEAAAVEQMRRVVPMVQLMKLSDEETVLLTGEEEPAAAAKALLAAGVSCVAVTLGEGGALVATRDGMQAVPGFRVDAVDTTGAGDAFWGAFLWKLSQSGVAPENLSVVQAVEFARFANAAAAVCITRRGAIPALPTREEVEKQLS